MTTPALDQTATTNTTADEEDVATDDQVRDLRAALGDQLERVRSLSLDEQLELTVDEQLALLVSIAAQYPDDALPRAVLTDDANHMLYSATRSFSGRLLLHLACDTDAPLEIIRWLLDHDATKRSLLHKDKWGDLPIHTACSRQNVEVVRLLVEADVDKTSIHTADNTGAYPLHMACRYNAPAQVLQLLLDCDDKSQTRNNSSKNNNNKITTTSSSLLVPGMSGQLPIHVACRCDLPPESIRLLLDYDRDKVTLAIPDAAGRLPLHVAYLRVGASRKNVLQMLLQAMVCGRMERMGLVQWKHLLQHSYIHAMEAVHERDFNANDKLELTRQALRKFLERAMALELAVWKASCCMQDGNRDNDYTNTNTHAEFSSVATMDHEVKLERRITSGADIILPHVLAFVEDEPITELLEQFQ